MFIDFNLYLTSLQKAYQATYMLTIYMLLTYAHFFYLLFPNTLSSRY